MGWGGVGRSTGRTMNAKKKGRTLPALPKHQAPLPGVRAGSWGLGSARCVGETYRGIFFGGTEGNCSLRARVVRDSVSTVEPREHGGGGTLLGTVPHFPGNPRARGVLGSLGGLEGSRVRGAGRSWEPKPASRRACRAGGRAAPLASRARSAQPARPVTSRVLPGWGRRCFWSRSGRALGGVREGEVTGAGLGNPPRPPGKQALPHILPAPRPFPAPFPAPEGPRETPLPGPRRAESCTSAGSRGQAEATLSLRPSRLARSQPVIKLRGPAHAPIGSGAKPEPQIAGEWGSPDPVVLCWTPTCVHPIPREPRADSLHDVPVGAAPAPPAQRPGQ